MSFLFGDWRESMLMRGSWRFLMEWFVCTISSLVQKILPLGIKSLSENLLLKRLAMVSFYVIPACR